MKFSPTKIAIALTAIFASGATLAAGTNFSNLSVGTVTNLSISQTGATASSRISNGGALTSERGAADTTAQISGRTLEASRTAARGVTFSRAGEDTGAFVQSGALTTLSLTQVGTATGVQAENAITGAMYTTGTGSVTVLQDGRGNVVDLAIGTTGSGGVSVATPTINITQKGVGNETELTRTGTGSNSDTIASYGNSNMVQVTGSATGTNSVNLTFGSDGARTSSSNQATISQEGVANVFAAQVTGSTNTLDIGQSGTTSQTFNTTSALGLNGIVGSGNHLYVRQSSSANAAHVAVLGDTNKVDVTQSGASGLARLALSGSSNNIDITQSAATNSALITLTSESAAFTLNQQTASASYTYTGTIPTGGSVSVTQ